MTSSGPSTRADRIALALAGGFLLAFLVGGLAFVLTLERDSAGSWRNVAAPYLGITVAAALYLGSAWGLVRLGRLSPRPPYGGARGVLARLALMLPSGAVGGAIAALIRADGVSVRRGMLEGAVDGLSFLLVVWLLGRLFYRPPRKGPAA